MLIIWSYNDKYQFIINFSKIIATDDNKHHGINLISISHCTIIWIIIIMSYTIKLFTFSRNLKNHRKLGIYLY
jgi:hypothetical protein